MSSDDEPPSRPALRNGNGLPRICVPEPVRFFYVQSDPATTPSAGWPTAAAGLETEHASRGPRLASQATESAVPTPASPHSPPGSAAMLDR